MSPRQVLSADDNPETFGFSETGIFDFPELPPANFNLTVVPQQQWTFSIPATARIQSDLGEPNGSASLPFVSGDGRFVTFVSSASNLVPTDANEIADIFLLDRVTGVIDRVNVSDDGVEADRPSIGETPSISDDGRFAVFNSSATTLVDEPLISDNVFVVDRQLGTIKRITVALGGGEGFSITRESVISGDGSAVVMSTASPNFVTNDNDFISDILVFDMATEQLELVSVGSAGIKGNGESTFPSISDDGRFVAFQSDANNLVAGDSNNVTDIFVYDRTLDVIERVSLNDNGFQGNGESVSPRISGNGRFVTFRSSADNLVAGDNNGFPDIFVFDRVQRVIQRVSVSNTGGEGNFGSFGSPSISDDGRFVVFGSDSDNLVSNDDNFQTDAFVYDRQQNVIASLGVVDFFDSGPIISGDGRIVSFASNATNLVPGAVDNNGQRDIFVTANPLIEPGVTRTLGVGDQIRDVALGLVPNVGVISGRVFEDAVENTVFDVGEQPLSDWTVYLDTNQNRVRDANEVTVRTDISGLYQFSDVPSFREHVVRVLPPAGWQQILPGASEAFGQSLFLPAGGEITGRDFAFRRVAGTAQSRNSAIRGRVYEDLNSNGVYDAGVDLPRRRTDVFLDVQNFGIRDINELAAVTDDQGNYSITDIGASVVSVTTILDSTTSQVSPQGSKFGLNRFPLFPEIQPFTNPQAVTSADFNNDGFPDVAVALGFGNTISIRLNDGNGGFTPVAPIDVDLGQNGGGPTSIKVGQFNGSGTALDLAVANNYASNVMVLMDFNGSGFDSVITVPVGAEPLDLDTAAIGGDPTRLDLVVVNKADNTIQVIRNNGAGGFTADPPISTGGVAPVSVVSGDFNADDRPDVAIAHALPSVAGSPRGDVSVLLADSAGRFTLPPTRYEVGAGPTDLIAGHFDGDDRIDLAVANAASNSITVLTGNADGTMTVQNTTLGTASGAFDIAAGDVDNDGDVDIVASNLRDRNVSVFRNVSSQGNVSFAPLEGIGVGEFGLATRMPLVLGDFDRKPSSSGGVGTLDIVAVPATAQTELNVLLNSLVKGSHRVQLNGTNQFNNLDFIVRPARLLPSMNPIADPQPIVEDAPQQSVTLSGIAKGREGGPPLRITAASSDPTVIPNPSVAYTAGESSAVLTYTPVANASGTVAITVTTTDAGADQTLDTADDGVLERTFAVTVLEVSDRTVVLTGSGSTFVLSQASSPGDAIQLIDIRGSGGNTLVLDHQQVLDVFPAGLAVVSDSDDVVRFDPGWQFVAAGLVDGRLVRRFSNAGAVLNLIGPNDFTNPINPFDVNFSGDVTSVDALQIINELNRRTFSDGRSDPEGQLRDFATLDFTLFRFYDVSGNAQITALDALRVLNQLAKLSATSSGEPEWVVPQQQRAVAIDRIMSEVGSEIVPTMLDSRTSAFSMTDGECDPAHQSDDLPPAADPAEQDLISLDETLRLLADPLPQ